MEYLENKEFYTIPEFAEMVGLSRIAIYKQVRQDKINAMRIGRIYVIHKNEIKKILNH